jgi:hypothetical protein
VIIVKELSLAQVEQVNGGLETATAIGAAGVWVGTVAGVGLAVVGAPALVAGAVVFTLGMGILTAVSLID